ncbi:IS30 family transposase [Corynebacterium glutamicum]|uniref:IS30 family transposase n=1 Tax=Corynebacterium glutamicum TaxID=1718 RepID=UPI000944657D|nr:IS30 family transposase [Corynebacterium glutamicum]OKX85622.1 IS30 family transposase [Corynebacterium glutamicum]QDX75564.1 transposase [Corynebacterium glutamicum]QDX78335.1 transposase [Corynebacterium glutamicum]TWS31400.1 transposase [Corynebacterium glutamicum]TWS39046.1 transposase [Corynebacterium glutamicum]
MVKSYGPFHSLTKSDRARLTVLVSNGCSVLSAAREVGCHYGHALNYCHTHGLIKPRTVQRDQTKAQQLIDLVRSGISVHDAAGRCGINDTVAYNIAIHAGCHIRLSRYQRHVRQTQLRVEYLRLRLAGLAPRDAVTAVGIEYRLGNDFERGVIKSNGPRKEFIPAGGDATTYNRLMITLRQRHDVIESGRLRTPALPRGVDPYQPISDRYISFEERVVIADLLREHVSIREISRRLGRSASSIAREVKRNHSAEGPYRGETAQLKSCARRLRPKVPKLIANKRLWEYVCDGLRAQWSPQQIAHRLPVDYPDDKDMRISHETIYDAFYLQSKGKLSELGLTLPRGRKKRKKRQPRVDTPAKQRFVDDMVLIDDRPNDVAERILPGHWEGDLILGKNNQSAVITLVERVSRFVVLGHLPGRHTSDEVLTALKNTVTRIDESMWSSITWDQGSEMAGHKAFTMATDIPIYFCHPGSPWERGSNENTNGRLRRNLPKGSDLTVYSAEDLEMIANIHNHTPRKALHWRTPAEVMAEALRQTGSIKPN